MTSSDNCCACTDGDSNGVVTIRPGQIGPSRNFPVILPADPDFQRCEPNYLVLQASVEIQRCVPTISEGGAVPDCAALTADALAWLEDAALVRQATSCCLKSLATPNGSPPTISRWSVGVSAPLEPLGGCGGSALTIWLGIPLCVCPD
jgi:hypothetical protein